MQEGIQAARKTFQRTRFHKTRCDLGLQVLRHYHRDWDPEKKIYTDHPVHDWSSHGADAFRYLSLSWKAERPQIAELTPEERTARLLRNNPSGQTFKTLKQQHFTKKRQERERAW